MDNRTRLSRLKKFAKILATVPKQKFQMGSWVNREALKEPCKIKPPSNFMDMSCKTAACALGWAAADKRFNKSGLRWGRKLLWTMGEIRYKNHVDVEAGAKFFGISRAEAVGLFLPTEYSTRQKVRNIQPHHVITKIKRLIREYS